MGMPAMARKWAALVCIGCGSARTFDIQADVYGRGGYYTRATPVQITHVPLKDGASDKDGPAGLDLTAL